MNTAKQIREPRADYLTLEEPALLREFELLATAEGGVAKLRELILSLAMSGRLLPQDHTDEPATTLLERIENERKTVSVSTRKNSAQPTTLGESPYKLPENWSWTALPLVYYSISVSDKKLPSAEVQKQGNIPVVDQGKRYIAGYTDDSSLEIRLPGPVIIFGDHTKEVKFVDFDFAAGADGVKILRPILQDERFFFYQLRSYRLEDRGYARHFRLLNEKLYALPPLAEQHRIVARVEELMTLCDELEARGRLADEQHARLTTTLFDALTASDSAQTLADNWQRIATHFDLLLDRPQAIDALEQTILQLAVCGSLVPQNPFDEPAIEVLTRIRAEKTRLVHASESKRAQPQPLNAIDAGFFEAPSGWLWVTFAQTWESSFYGPRFAAGDYVATGGTPTIRTTDMSDGRIVLRNAPCVSVPDAKRKLYLARQGDLLVTRSGSIGVMALFDLGVDAIPSAYLIRLRFNESVAPAFAHLFLTSPMGSELLGLSTTSVGVPNVSASKMAQFPMPLPPLAEQHRIVARVEHLRSLCDDLRAQLNKVRATQTDLAETLVTEAVQPRRDVRLD